MKNTLRILFFVLFFTSLVPTIFAMETVEHTAPALSAADLGLGDEQPAPEIIIPKITNTSSVSEVIRSCKLLPFARKSTGNAKPNSTIVDMPSFIYILDFNNSFFYRKALETDLWTTPINPFIDAYVEKKIFTTGMPLYIHGDIHGDVKSLALYLEELMAEGLLDDHWHLAPSCNPIFLGDYIDRGIYNIETLFMLAMLKAFNQERVTLIQGNHDLLYPCIDPALTEDLIRVIPNEKERDYCLYALQSFLKSLPAALYAQVKTTPQPESPIAYTLLFCHGGCSYEHATVGDFLRHPTHKYEASPFSPIYSGNIYSLVDFQDTTEDFAKLEGEVTGHGQLLYRNGAIDWMNRHGISAIFRGHQHSNSISERFLHLFPARFMKKIIDGNGVAKLWRPETIPATQQLWNYMVCTLNVSPDNFFGEDCGFNYDTFVTLTLADTFEASVYEQYQIPVLPTRQ
jgi:hypothetical protein